MRESIGVSWAGRCAAGVSWIVMLGAVAMGWAGCAKPRVSDLDAYQVVPMNRVVPYPADAEREKRVNEVAVIDRPSEDVDEQTLRKPRSQVRMGLEKIAASHGAAVIDRSKPGFDAVRVDRADSGFDGIETVLVPSGDYAISTRFTTYQHQATWSKPNKMPWDSEAELAKKPGTCAHTAAVDFDVQLVQKAWEDAVRHTFLVHHSAKQEAKDLDQACTIAPVSLETLFETAIDEALSCLDLPLGTRVSPRGHVIAHRVAREGEGHIYQVSLGAEQGIDAKEPVEIRRVDLSQDAEGKEIRNERVIATGVATDQIRAQDSWIAVNMDDVTTEILEGDVVRRVFSKGLINDLSGPNCKKIVVER